MSTTTNDWISDIYDLHTKFGVRSVVEGFTPEKLRKFIEFRFDFLKEEYEEGRSALESNDPNKAEDIVDALIDLCVVAIGTLDALGVDTSSAWHRVHEKNMQKEVGIKPSRPNPLGLPDLIKPNGWTAPSHADNVGLIPRIFT